MDIGAFSDDQFDPVAWINTTYSNSSQKDRKEEFVSSLVSKLQLYVQQISSTLEDTSQQVLAGMPRVLKDTQNLHNEVLSLKAKMSEVQNEISQVQEETGECMANLERLDGLKTKLQIAKQGLQESDGWGKLVSELEDLFERNDIPKICSKLGALQKSLAAQEGLAGQSDRESQVDGFKNRLEALTSPSIVQAFTIGDIENSKKFVEIFTNMGRYVQLTQYYRTVQKAAFQQHWNEVIDLSENSTRFLHDFYEFLFEGYKKQSKWCSQVFGDKDGDEALFVLVELLPILQPSREAAVLESLKRSNDKLEILMDFSAANEHFATLMLKHWSQQSTSPSTENKKLLAKAIFDYFNTFIIQYPAIEQNNLAMKLANLNVIQSTTIETIRHLGNANKKVLEWIESSVERCEKITQCCALAPLVIVLNSICKNFIEKYKKAQQQLSASRNIEQDWNLLQNCISLLQHIGELHLSMEEFEETLSQKVVHYNEKRSDSEQYFGYRILEKRELNEYKKLVLKIQEYNSKISSGEDTESAPGIFSSVFEAIKPICVETHDVALAAVFAPIEKHLAKIEPPTLLNSSGTDLPDYSLAPREFITQIGHYLLSLPQHLEPLLLSPSSALKTALELCEKKYTENVPSADILLSLVVEECCALYQTQILSIQALKTTEAKQIATDIEYLGSVLEELGIILAPQLQKTAVLLRASPDNYLNLSAGCDPKLVTAVRQMRNIISTE